jgi:small subunit ribosomal protein S20
MPNIKSAKERVLVNEKKAQANKAVKSALKTQIKKFLAAVSAGDKETAAQLYPVTVAAIDEAASKGIIHKNNANNKKAKLAKKLNSLAA